MRSVEHPQSFCRAGAARGDITPPVGAYHRMWGAATHDRSTGVHRPLTATVVALRPAEPAEDASAGIVLIGLDHCILDDRDIQAIRQSVAGETSFSAESVVVCLSHTHGAGLMARDRADLPGGDLLAPYLEGLARDVGRLARKAEDRLCPAAIGYARGRCDLATHRDFFDEEARRFVCGFNPGHPADDTLLVARIRSRERAGDVIATVVNYACHPTTLAWENTLISPDYVGATREVVERATGRAPCLFLQGASGELGPREGFVGDVNVADRNGRRLGFSALAAMESLPSPGTRFEYRGPVVSGAVLGTWGHAPLDAARTGVASRWRQRSWRIDVPYRPGLPTLEETRASRVRLQAAEDAARGRGEESAARDLRAQVEQMTRQIMRLEALPRGASFPLPVTVLQLGDAMWVHVAGEHYSVLQTRLRERFPDVPLLVTTIANGWQPGYLPTAETYGKGIYQESIAMVAPGSLERVIDEVAQQVEGWLAGPPRPECR